MANEVNIVVKTRDDGGRGFTAQERRAKGLKGTLTGLGAGFKTVAGSAVAFGALQVFKNSLRGASDLNEAMSKVDVVFGKSAGQIHKWSTSTATSMGLSRTSAERFAGSLGLIFTQMGSTTREAAKMSTQWVKLAADIGSFNNADPSQVLEAMESATRGEYDALQQFVPSVNAAAIEHEALAQSGKKSAEALTAHDKLLALQKLLFKDTAKAQGDFARTQNSAANQQKIMNAQWEDAQAKLGKGLLPILVKATQTLNKMIAFGSRNKEWLGPVTAGLLALAAALKAVAVAQALANTAALANPYVRLAAVILAVAAAFVVAWKRSQTFRNIVVDVGVTAAQVFIRAAQILVGAFLEAFNAVVQGAAKAFGWLPGVGERIRNSAKDIRKWKDSVVGSFDRASDSVERWGERTKQAGNKANSAGTRAYNAFVKSARGAGLSRDAAVRLANAIRRVPGRKSTSFPNNAAAAAGRVRRLMAIMNNIPRRIATQIAVNLAVSGLSQNRPNRNRWYGGITGAQSGGLRSNQTMVGEHGPEILDLPPGTRVRSNPDTERTLRRADDGGRPLEINLNLDGQTLATVLFDPLKGMVRKRGGKGPGSAQRAWGTT